MACVRYSPASVYGQREVAISASSCTVSLAICTPSSTFLEPVSAGLRNSRLPTDIILGGHGGLRLPSAIERQQHWNGS